jgi:pimeloyl-ACP methyl ester carboxylesterase
VTADQRIDVGGHELRCRSEGPAHERAAEAPTFVCLHGLVDTLEIWDKLAPALALRGHVVRFDQRGHGESDAPPGACTREDLAADVVAVLDAHRAPRAILVGHSMGGIVSLAAALRYPDRIAGLVLLGTASQCNERTAAWYERIAEAGERDGTDGLRRAIYGERSRRPVAGNARGIAAVTRMLGSLHSRPLTPELEKLACPVLLLVGEKDPMGSRATEIIAESLPAGAATLQVLPGCGHWIHVEAAAAVTDAIDRWLPATTRERSNRVKEDGT